MLDNHFKNNLCQKMLDDILITVEKISHDPDERIFYIESLVKAMLVGCVIIEIEKNKVSLKEALNKFMEQIENTASKIMEGKGKSI